MTTKQELLSAYLVVGADELKSKKAVKRMKARLDESFAAFNLDEMEPTSDMEPGSIVTSLNTLPVGAGFRLVIIHNADKLPKPVSEAIIDYLKNPNPDCVLLLQATTLRKTARLYKAVKAVGARYDFTQPIIDKKNSVEQKADDVCVSEVVWEYYNGLGWRSLAVKGSRNPFAGMLASAS